MNFIEGLLYPGRNDFQIFSGIWLDSKIHLHHLKKQHLGDIIRYHQ